MQETYYATAAAVLVALTAWALTGVRRRFDLLSALLWACVLVVGTLVTLALGRQWLDLHKFGAINVLVRALFVGVPVAAALIAVRSARRGWRATVSLAGGVAIVLGLLMGPLGIYATVIEPSMLVVHQQVVPVTGLPGGSRLRVGVISDIQTTNPGPHEQAAIDAMMAQKPDVIVIPGDLLQVSDAVFQQRVGAMRDLIGQLSAPGGVFLVEGDSDSRARVQAVTAGTDVIPLVNDVATARVSGVRLAVGGMELAYWNPGAPQLVAKLAATPADVRILLAHRPDAVGLVVPGDGIALTIAGHTHGGQVQLPFVGPLLTQTNLPRQVAAGGLHDVDGDLIYVSTGVGFERNQAPRIRFGVPPSIDVLTLSATP